MFKKSKNWQKIKFGEILLVKKIIAGLVVSFLFVTCFVMSFCKKQTILIYTSTEDYTMEYLQEQLNKEFDEYDVKVEYMSTSNIAAKIIAEGELSDCDIVFAEEYGYVEQMMENGVIVNLTNYFDEQDYAVYTDEALNTSAKDYLLPGYKMGGGIVVNTALLDEQDIPTSYEDLLNPKYKGQISMPSPKSSATGYMFFLSLVNEWGEDRAIEYFDEFAKNVNAFTTSGSKPVNMLVQREVSIGLGMLSQAAEKITAGNNELKIIFFEEGAPFNMCGNCVVKGKENKKGVMEIMDYIHTYFTPSICEKFYPETILKDREFTLNNFPTGIKYADMSFNTLNRKEELLKRWKH